MIQRKRRRVWLSMTDMGETGEILFEMRSETHRATDHCLDTDSNGKSPAIVVERQHLLTDPEHHDDHRMASRPRQVWQRQLLPTWQAWLLSPETSRPHLTTTQQISPWPVILTLWLLLLYRCMWDSQTLLLIPWHGQTVHVALCHGSRIRSRFGRPVTPVDRLMQTLSGQDAVQDKFSV